jgi:tRNA A-37 threonylcarbamoyl transferase component Bud32
MIFENPAELKDRIERLSNRRVGREPPRIFEDTSSYMSIYGGCVLRLDGNDYFVLGDTREGRFGIDDQPKVWVKYALDLTTGDHKIIKLVFYEEFEMEYGFLKLRFRRNPEKESEILESMRGHDRFMQGFTVIDPAGNRVRIIDFIRGKTLYGVLRHLEMDHEQYMHERLPGIMREVIACIEALAELHRRGLHHGDVRNDHIIAEARTGRFTWIDFDFQVNYSDYDVWSMGNVLTFVVGNGLHTFRGVQREPKLYPHLTGELDEDDAILLSKHRIANLRKLFPYLSAELNEVLLRFSCGASYFYEDLESQLADLRAVFG